MSLFIRRVARNHSSSNDASASLLIAENSSRHQSIRRIPLIIIAASAATMMVLNTSFFSGYSTVETTNVRLPQRRILKAMDGKDDNRDTFFMAEQFELQQVVEILDRLGIETLCETALSSRISGCDNSNVLNQGRRLEACTMEDIPWGLSRAAWNTINIVGSIFCVFAVALMSSMFLGFMTLDPLDLRIKIRASVDSEERENAAKLLPLVEDHHRLLVTLLLVDAVFYETMPLFLDNLFPSWLAILLSVTVLLVVGEIIPSAIFTGPQQLRLASQMTPLMSFFLKVLYPLAAPLIWLLNSMVPPEDPEEEAYNREEMSALVRIQYEEREEARRTVNFTGLVPTTGKAPNRKSHAPRGPAVGPVKGPGNVLTVTDKSRGWRNLKREIMEAVEQRHHDSQNNHFLSTNSSTSSPVHHTFHDRGHRRNRSPSIGSDHESIHSISTGPAYEQIAPPLHQAEVKMVEGALTMKTKVGT
jgi:Cyclin M transmembrane N-terminal domain